ncbi:hypothetical protein DFJ58DRAFT_847050 [Suillus subalutaceus]|uniref:uncharacterized protein n=1 Tax=Suillus subalutaceus TaxID=48586 RepID=UPI001B872760|nr:uncharacterized protein DFJ58DRAFT_847050 [Suillus subalutaceus]KAG1836285.1 hypothetical protein DFJ58DRAFT_847050 [Suillus subalutaceus]
MPPKRRTAAKSAPAPAKPAAPPAQPKPTATPAVKQAAPPPQPPPPPPPVETPSAKVRKEWLNFISTWYEPEKKKLVDQLTKELDAKYKKSSSRIQQNPRHVEMEKRLSEITTRLAEPAHEEWNSRLAAVQLRVDDWTDITQEEQQSVINVFNAFYEDNEEDEGSTPFDSNEIDESVALAAEEPQLGDSSPFFTTRQSPPTPITANFQLVNPSSFFTDTISPAKQARKLPELAMPKQRSLRLPRLGFRSWLSSPPSASQSQSTNRNRATDNISRQASAASSASPPLFSSHSPPQPTTKISPLSATHTLLPGKRYIGPVIAEEEAEPIDEELLKAKMAADFLEFKMDVRIEMIQQFHAKASAIEIELARLLESNNSTCSRESRLLTLHEHEENMLSLRESKELERKKLCDQERDRRLQEHRILQQAAAQKAINQTRFNASASSSKIPPATQAGWTTHAPKLASQKENLSTGSLPTKPDPPSILKKSASAHVIPGFDEAAFLKDQAEAASFAKGKQPVSAIASSRPSALKKTESSSSQDEPFEPPAPPTAKGKKGKKTPGVTQQPKTVTFNQEPDADAEPPPVWGAKSAKASVSSKSVMIEEEPDEDADPLFAAWNSKTARATTSAPVPAAKKGKAAVVEEVVEPAPPVISVPSWGSASGWGSAAAGKKGKAPMVPTEPMEDPFQTWTAPVKKGKAQAATIPAEPTEDPFQTWTAPAKKGKAQAPIIPAEPTEDPFQTWTAPAKKGKAQAPVIPVESMEDPYQTWTAPSGGWATKKTKVTVTEEPDEEAETAWGVGLKGALSSSKQAKKVAPPQLETQPEARRGAQSSSKSVLVQDVSEDEEEEEEEEEGEEEWDQIRPASAIPDTTGEAESDGWGSSYWSNLAKGQPISQAADESAPHMLWTPSMDAEESGDEDSGEGMESALWMQYAISGGELAGFEAPEPQENVHTHAHAHAHVPVKSTPAASNKKPTNDPTTSIWEQGKGKKKSAPAIETKIEPTRASSARTAQWPKAKMEMENWASRLGQSSGSARHFYGVTLVHRAIPGPELVSWLRLWLGLWDNR